MPKSAETFTESSKHSASDLIALHQERENKNFIKTAKSCILLSTFISSRINVTCINSQVLRFGYWQQLPSTLTSGTKNVERLTDLTGNTKFCLLSWILYYFLGFFHGNLPYFGSIWILIWLRENKTFLLITAI